MHLHGLGIGGYRSFGRETQYIAPLEKISLIVGQNNAGKSNVLRFVSDLLPDLLKKLKDSSASVKIGPLDEHIANEQLAIRLPVQFSLAIDTSSDDFAAFIDGMPNPRYSSKLVRSIFESSFFRWEDSLAWFDFQYDSREQRITWLQSNPSRFKAELHLSDSDWGTLQSVLLSERGGTFSTFGTRIMQRILPNHLLSLPGIEIISANRKIGGKADSDLDYSGLGIIQRLARLQHPRLEEQHLKDRFQDITDFVRNVTGVPDASIDVPFDREMILIEMNGRLLPLESLGTGIHEVVILAVAATVLNGHLIGIEEPELHLHPILQKKLLRYLQDKTDNQYLITTHSAHILDLPESSIFHVRQIDGVTRIERAFGNSHRTAICADLGYRASDLLQANCVIWVEGPSDRIYLEHWIRSYDERLVETVHYSIMFYGGRLLAHLSADDEEVGDFISLRRLNRYLGILIDSDRKADRAHINKTKQRVKREFESPPGFCWITKGREIENYIPVETLQRAIVETHRDFQSLHRIGQFEHQNEYVNRSGEVKLIDKVKVAHAVAKEDANFDVLDLRERIREVVRFIRSANDLGELQ